jgi:urease subunit beta/urease subunit gamma/beta
MKPGEYFLKEDRIEPNEGRRKVSVQVSNTGDRAVQVGSHFHFFEVNKALDFDRNGAMGMRLNILAGNTLRFEPGDTRTVELVEFGGGRRAMGFNNLVDGSVDDRASVQAALARAQQQGYKGVRAGTDG